MNPPRRDASKSAPRTKPSSATSRQSSSSSARGKAIVWRSKPCCSAVFRACAAGRTAAAEAARGSLDTSDLVQETVLHVLRRLDHFEPRHVGAMQAYLRLSVINRIRDEVRKVSRRPVSVDCRDLVSDRTSPLEVAVQAEAYQHYRQALGGLGARDRELVVARIEAQWSVAEIAKRFEMPTPDAARMAVGRAIKRLTTKLHGKKES